MSSEWVDTSLGNVVRFDSGNRNSQDAIATGEYPFFTCSREILRHSEYDFDREAVIMAGNNAEARFHLQYYHGRFAARQRTYVMSPLGDDLDCRYLFYALQRLQPHFRAHAQGTTTKFVTIGILRAAPIYLPPKREQKAIAHILGTLDDKIELNRKTNETLEAMAKALFQSWFVDFDPVRAMAEGRPTGLPAEISDLFSDSLEESELGEIPRGWEIAAIDHIINL
jgi:type I restriction enzyme S subunit